MIKLREGILLVIIIIVKEIYIVPFFLNKLKLNMNVSKSFNIKLYSNVTSVNILLTLNQFQFYP